MSQSRQNGANFAVRRAHAAGTSVSGTSAAQQVYGDEEIMTACKDLLKKKLGEYHIFGAGFEVCQSERDQDVTLVKYLGALPGCELADTGIRRGYFFPLGQIFGAFSRAMKDGNLGNLPENTAVLLAFLMGHPIMVMAIREAMDEHRQQEGQKQASARSHILNGFDAILTKTNSVQKPTNKKPKAPTLEKVEDLVSSSWGKFVAHDGVEFTVCYLGFGPKPKTVVVRVTDVPEGHPMKEMKDGQVHIFQSALQYEADMPMENIEGKALLAARFRAYVRGLLKEAGYTFSASSAVAQVTETLPAASSETVAA